MGKLSQRAVAILWFMVAVAASAFAQESAYFVTYNHQLEEPGNLEISVLSTTGVPRAGTPGWFAPFTELEYGVTGWWTTELYLEGQSTRRESTVFTGWRIEN